MRGHIHMYPIIHHQSANKTCKITAFNYRQKDKLKRVNRL